MILIIRLAYDMKLSFFNSAGIGVLNAARKTMARMLGNNEFAFEGARSQFWVVDAMVRAGFLVTFDCSVEDIHFFYDVC